MDPENLCGEKADKKLNEFFTALTFSKYITIQKWYFNTHLL